MTSVQGNTIGTVQGNRVPIGYMRMLRTFKFTRITYCSTFPFNAQETANFDGDADTYKVRKDMGQGGMEASQDMRSMFKTNDPPQGME